MFLLPHSRRRRQQEESRVTNNPQNRKPMDRIWSNGDTWWAARSNKVNLGGGAGAAVCYPTERERRTSPVSRFDYQRGRALPMQPTRQLPQMPEIRRPESYYAKLVHQADRAGDTHSHEASKVGQYVTLAMDPSLDWSQKLKNFQHALKRHCVPPPYPDDDVWMFYQQLADLVRPGSAAPLEPRG
jgi:hypothetical protein